MVTRPRLELEMTSEKRSASVRGFHMVAELSQLQISRLRREETYFFFPLPLWLKAVSVQESGT